ncbi:MAG: guanylate kinase [Gammaproteobacteria bacterium]|nr:guanylate kinase [Gammaproteobacteria bacterium]
MSNPDPRARGGHLFVVAAPSGAGKTTLIEELLHEEPSLVVSVSHTTRPKRASETDGIHYHFVDEATFASLRDADEFLEWARVFDHAYGTSRDTVVAKLAAGRDVILEIDWQGAAQIRQRHADAVSIFVLPPSQTALIERLHARGQDRPEVIAKRLQQAVDDMSHHDEFDYLVVNDDFDDAVLRLRRIVQATRDGEPLPKEDHSALLDELLRTPPVGKSGHDRATHRT